MVYGNNGDSFSLMGGSGGFFRLYRHGLRQVCQHNQGDGCGDFCACFQRYHDGENIEVHLCCCSPPVVIRIKDVA